MKKIFLVGREELAAGVSDLPWERTREMREAEAIVVIGGDGSMLHAIQRYRDGGLPFIGLHRSDSLSSYGFLMNELDKAILAELGSGRIKFVESRLLAAELWLDGGSRTVYAFNDMNVERVSTQTLRVNVAVNNEVFFQPISCDGILVATPAGSTAYNANAGGAILPADNNGFILTGLSPKMSFHWNSSVLAEKDVVYLEVTETAKRPARFVADGVEQTARFSRATIYLSDRRVRLGFAAGGDFRKKVLDLQFRGRSGR